MRALRLAALLLVAAPPLPAQGTAPATADSAVRAILDLPRILDRARRAGASDSSISGMIDIIRRRGLPPEEAVPAVEMEVEALEQGAASKDSFGSFVRAQVESGLRGRALAEAIRQQRARRGMGPKEGRGNGNARGQGGPPAGRGRPNAAQPQGGRPEGAGRPGGSGRPVGTERTKPTDDSTRGKAPAPRTRRP